MIARTGIALALVLAAAALLGGGVAAQPTAPAADAKHGAVLFRVDGCYECHGFQGEGTGVRAPRGIVGPMLAPNPIPYAAFVKQLRAPRAVMAPYSEKVLSDRDAADIYAYLASIPAAKPASSIPLLQSVKPAAGQ